MENGMFMRKKYESLPPDYQFMYQYFIETFEPDKDEYPDSFVENVFGITYRWFNSFKDIRPLDYYKNIDIPVLFVHGDNDINVPVVSTIFIQENLPEKPFSYKYFGWAHQPQKYSDVIAFRDEIAEWIMNIDL
jgi:dipeptidyl aminopeptidase/acylaminoacyl peptidase